MRDRRLDILRCVAVVLVMLRHSELGFFWTRVGWTGVDLFFVLSGFLISGLLFGEYKARRAIDFKRFLARRALKIYPAFYAFLALTGLVALFVLHETASVRRYACDVFFVMNYCRGGVWEHTWSLAVEEHFYLFLPLLLHLLHRSARGTSDREDPFRAIPKIFLLIAMACLGFRILSVETHALDTYGAYTSSHTRIDGLFFGVVIGYGRHFQAQAWERFFAQPNRRGLVLLVSLALLSIVFWFPVESPMLVTVGLSCTYLGFGGILCLTVFHPPVRRGALGALGAAVAKAMAYVGMFSYSIYLWHAPIGAWLPGTVRRLFHSSDTPTQRFIIYFIGSFVVGIAMSKLIEYPILRLRNQLFPAPVLPEGRGNTSRWRGGESAPQARAADS